MECTAAPRPVRFEGQHRGCFRLVWAACEAGATLYRLRAPIAPTAHWPLPRKRDGDRFLNVSTEDGPFTNELLAACRGRRWRFAACHTRAGSPAGRCPNLHRVLPRQAFAPRSRVKRSRTVVQMASEQRSRCSRHRQDQQSMFPFPNSLSDCITPSTCSSHAQGLRNLLPALGRCNLFNHAWRPPAQFTQTHKERRPSAQPQTRGLSGARNWAPSVAAAFVRRQKPQRGGFVRLGQ